MGFLTENNQIEEVKNKIDRIMESIDHCKRAQNVINKQLVDIEVRENENLWEILILTSKLDNVITKLNEITSFIENETSRQDSISQIE